MDVVTSDGEKMAKKTIYVPRFGSQTNEPREYVIDTPPTRSQKKKKRPNNGLSSKKLRKVTTFRHRASNEKVGLNDDNTKYNKSLMSTPSSAVESYSTSCQGMVCSH